MNFSKYKFKGYINDALSKINFVEPTKVQSEVMPLALKKKSLIVESATGSGKTHAFMLPIIQNIIENRLEVQAIIISPTRELAEQLYDVAYQLTAKTKISIAKVYGGSDRETEIKKYEKAQPQIVIGTIGRIKDLAVDSNALKIHSANAVVIDEADMIFEEKELIEVDQIMKVIQGMPQFLIFSATLPKGLRVFLSKYLNSAQVISLEEKTLTTSLIEHIMVPCKARNKDEVLLEVVKSISPYLALIFANKKETVDYVAKYLAERGYKVGKIHGDLDDRIRKQTIRRIKDLEYQYVVASDIAARGIDIAGVSHVINYELPKDIEFYIHRTGRTGRANQKGMAISLYDYDDLEYIINLRAKGLKPVLMKVTNGELVLTKLPKKNSRISPSKQFAIDTHRSIALPKKVKPGYKKKRMEKINKEVRKFKRSKIEEIYKNKRGQKND